MGMNYYHHTEICEHCKRSDVQHIGKSSYGWAFAFQATEDARSYRDWLEKFEGGGEIRNEDYNVIPLEDFKKMVTNKQGGRNHALEYPDHNFVDPEGYSFLEYDFIFAVRGLDGLFAF